MHTLDTIRSIKFGYGFMGNNRTFKCRYSNSLAEQILSRIPEASQKLIIKHMTSNGHTFLCVVQHASNSIWVMLERAINNAKADKLGATARQLRG